MGVRSYTLRYTEVRLVFSLFRSLSEFEVVLNGNHRIVAVESVLPPPLHTVLQLQITTPSSSRCQ